MKLVVKHVAASSGQRCTTITSYAAYADFENQLRHPRRQYGQVTELGKKKLLNISFIWKRSMNG